MRNRLTALRKTRENLVRYGWCQGEYVNSDGRHCLLGATPTWGFSFVRDALVEMVGSDFRPAVWNDMPGRTEEEVLALLDQAIRIEEGKP